MYVGAGSWSNCSSSSARRYFARIFVALLELGEVEPLPRARLAEAVSDLEHGPGIVGGYPAKRARRP